MSFLKARCALNDIETKSQSILYELVQLTKLLDDLGETSTGCFPARVADDIETSLRDGLKQLRIDIENER